MKRYFTHIISFAVITMATVVLSSCGDDDEPVPPTVTFQSASSTVGEGAGTIEVNLQLDKNAPSDITVRYALTGTAIEGTTTSADYKVVGKFGEIVIAQGSTSGSIQLEIKQDAAVEANETIIITINSVVNDAAVIGTSNQTTITIENDDLGAKVSFAEATATVNESDGADGLLEIGLVLDIPAPQDLTVSYEFNYEFEVATAIDAVYGESEEIPAQYFDFEVDGDYGQVVIPSGSTTGKISIQLFTDFLFENDEMIEITLTSVSAGGQVGTTPKTTITLEQQDGKIIALFWDPNYDDVDMDMFLWVGEDVGNLTDLLALAARPLTDPQEEIIFVPEILTTGETAAFGLSYVYYEGTEEPMDFEVQFIDYADGVVEPLANREVFEASYTLANINPWDNETTGTDPQIEQTVLLVNGVYTDFSDPITVPTSGSRVKTQSIPPGYQKDRTRFSMRSLQR